MEKHEAQESLEVARYSPAKLFAIHAGALTALSLVLAAISYILSGINTEGGLDTMNLQAALSTAQVMLQLVELILTPLWAAGLTYAVLAIARRQEISPKDLTRGFGAVKPLLTSGVLLTVQYIFRAIISMFISLQVFMFTPAANKIYEASLTLPESTEVVDLELLLGADYSSVMLTMAGVFLAVFAVVCIPLFYRYRMVNYLIMDGEISGLGAMLRSRIMMTRRRWELAKLDLSFWWYYLLMALGTAICFGDSILSAAGVALPFSKDVAYWLFLCLGTLAQLAVRILAGPKVEVTYALRYDRYLNEVPPESEAPQPPAPKNLPWSY